MAVDITTPKATAPDPPEPEEERVSGWELFRWVYRFFYSKTVGLVLILAMAVLVLFGTVGVGRDWFDTDSVYRSPVFVVVSALLSASILACTAHRLPLLWKSWRHPRLVVPAQAYDRARYRAAVPVDGGDVEVMDQVREVLKEQRYRVRCDPDHPKAVYADRFAWGPMGAAVSHLSFVVIIAAVVISMNGGIDTMLLVPVGGAPVEVGEGTSLSVTATSYESSHTAAGRPTDYVSHLVVTKNGRQVAERDVRVNSPLRVGGVSFYQSAWRDGVTVAATGPDGALFDGFAPTDYDFRNDGTMYAAVVRLDGDLDTGLALVVAVPAGWDPVAVARDSTLPTASEDPFVVEPGQAVLQVYKAGILLDEALVDAGGEWVVGDFAFTFVREQQSPIVQVRRDPGEPFMWAGSILLVIGITVVFTCRHRRLWATWDDGSSRIRFASADKNDTAWARRFRATVEAVAQQVGSAAHHGPAPGQTAGGSTRDEAGEQAEASRADLEGNEGEDR